MLHHDSMSRSRFSWTQLWFRRLVACTTNLLLLLPLSADAGEIDFQTEIQPILSEHCARCHGVDAGTRESGLRLDQREAALAGGDSGEPAIVPGDPDASVLMQRILIDDESMVMPPVDEHKPLSEQQIATLRQWIVEGAPYAEHWAFTAPQQVDADALVASQGAAEHPVDAIVGAKLKQWGLERSDPAPDWQLCRRLYLDLVGLPPSPEQLAEFQQQGFDATVDRLLSSTQYGEKWARHWLDVARYSDTNGYEKDLPREQWAWRDWVIDALNQDKPYNEFIIEQIAGDLLDQATQSQIVATGFLRNSMINEEGAIIPEEFRMVEMFDRMDCVGKAVLGLTTQCAQCHSHKFDPLTHDEYFGMFAYLNNCFEARSWVYDEAQQQQLAEFQRRREQLNRQFRESRADWAAELRQWEASMLADLPQWSPLRMEEFGSVSGLNHPVAISQHRILMLGHASSDVFFIAEPGQWRDVTGVQLEVLTHDDLPFRGPGRNDVGDWRALEFEVLVQRPGEGATEPPAWEKLKLTHATADWSQPPPPSGEEDQPQKFGPVDRMIDGDDNTGWRVDRGPGRRNQSAVAVFQFDSPLQLTEGTRLKFAIRTHKFDMFGCCRISLTTAENPTAPPVDHDAVLALQIPQAERTAEQQELIFDAWRRSLPEQESWAEQYEALWQEYPSALTSVLHLRERPESMRRTTHLLDRGEWNAPLSAVDPHTPAALHPLVKTDEPPRLQFARWLASEQSPLTARVAVNRVWQAMFGEGLVETSEDFGTRAPVPEHLELLDWLAVDFMRHGWSQKHLIRRIVTSRTYQQDSRADPQARQRDPRNRLLARGPRFRAEAEVIRDIALTVSGLLHEKVGGPSVIPPVPQNVLDYNYTYPAYWKPAAPPERYRRTVYAFRKRSMPDPVLTNFDSPNSDTACARRVRSNTPLAALTGLNETIFVEAARALAERVLRAAPATDAARADYAFLLCTSRSPSDAERQAIIDFVSGQRARLAPDPSAVAELLAIESPGEKPLSEEAGAALQDAAAWTLAARILLNLDETITKN